MDYEVLDRSTRSFIDVTEANDYMHVRQLLADYFKIGKLQVDTRFRIYEKGKVPKYIQEHKKSANTKFGEEREERYKKVKARSKIYTREKRNRERGL